MPLMSCPECGKQISDSATACPHCGYPLSSLPPVRARFSRRSTPLDDTSTNGAAGVVWLVVAIVGVPAVIFAFLFGFILGFLVLFGDLLLWGLALNNLQGTRKGICPYCNGDITVTDLNASAMKCPHCKKRFAIKEDSLETLE